MCRIAFSRNTWFKPFQNRLCSKIRCFCFACLDRLIKAMCAFLVIGLTSDNLFFVLRASRVQTKRASAAFFTYGKIRVVAFGIVTLMSKAVMCFLGLLGSCVWSARLLACISTACYFSYTSPPVFLCSNDLKADEPAFPGFLSLSVSFRHLWFCLAHLGTRLLGKRLDVVLFLLRCLFSYPNFGCAEIEFSMSPWYFCKMKFAHQENDAARAKSFFAHLAVAKMVPSGRKKKTDQS